jgi:hypothetical protein
MLVVKLLMEMLLTRDQIELMGMVHLLDHWLLWLDLGLQGFSLWQRKHFVLELCVELVSLKLVRILPKP